MNRIVVISFAWLFIAKGYAVEAEQERVAIDRYLGEIDSIEAQHGAYASGLAEPLLGLASLLNARGQYKDALAMYKRGVHLSRVNDGLYSPTQLPHLEGEISSLIAAGNYIEADDRQRYLYRVQKRALNGTGLLPEAQLKHADWHYQAYRLGLDKYPHNRLMQMRDLYGQALQNIANDPGEDPESALAPMQGMLKTRYLIADFEAAYFRQNPYVEDLSREQELREFELMQRKNIDRGRELLLQMYSVHQTLAAKGGDPAAPARTLVQLGDWHFYNGNRRAAASAYQAAAVELDGQNGAKLEMAKLFGDPVPLPDIDGLRPLPKGVSPTQGDIVVEFGVNTRGRAFAIERLDDNEAYDATASRLMRILRLTRFRPRYEAGQPVQTTGMTYAYDVR